MMTFFVFGFWIVCGVLGGVLAQKKNRSVGGWAIGSFLFPPVLLILLALDEHVPIETPIIEPNPDDLFRDNPNYKAAKRNPERFSEHKAWYAHELEQARKRRTKN